MGNIFMKKCDDVFEAAKKFTLNKVLKKDYDLLVVDIHGEITSEKMAMGHFFDGQATLVIGTHTHVPTSDTMILKKGTAYQSDAGMCGDYNSVIGMNKENSLNKFFNPEVVNLKHNGEEKEFILTRYMKTLPNILFLTNQMKRDPNTNHLQIDDEIDLYFSKEDTRVYPI